MSERPKLQFTNQEIDNVIKYLDTIVEAKRTRSKMPAIDPNKLHTALELISVCRSLFQKATSLWDKTLKQETQIADLEANVQMLHKSVDTFSTVLGKSKKEINELKDSVHLHQTNAKDLLQYKQSAEQEIEDLKNELNAYRTREATHAGMCTAYEIAVRRVAEGFADGGHSK